MYSEIIIAGIAALLIGGGFAYSKYKNHQIDEYREQNRELAMEKAAAEMEASKAKDEARAVDAARDLTERIYQAAMSRKEAEKGSDTPLSEEDRKIAKDIMDNDSGGIVS